MDHVETVFVNWFYPQNSELLHAVGMLMTGRDTLSLFINFGWLAVAFLAAYCVGRPYGRGIPAVIAAAILAGCHTLVVREPGRRQERPDGGGAPPRRHRDPDRGLERPAHADAPTTLPPR